MIPPHQPRGDPSVPLYNAAIQTPCSPQVMGEIPLGPWGPAQCAACNGGPLKVQEEMCLGSQGNRDEGSPHREGLQLLVLPLNGFGGLD